MYGFGDEEQTEQQGQVAAPKWFRERMDKVSEQLAELKAENDRLKDQQARQAVKDTLTAQGYAPQVADLYSGKPEGLNDWLGTYGAALAKGGNAAEGEQQQAPTGPPATTVSPEDQAAMAQMSAAGQGAAPAAAGDDQLLARINAAQTQEELDTIFREAGSPYFRNN